MCDVWVYDSVVAVSHLTKNIACEVPPTAAYQEAIVAANHSVISPLYGRAVSSEHTQSLDGINSPFQAKDSTISVNIAHLNFQALLDIGAAVTAVSARVCQKCASNISLNLGPPNHDSITTVDGYSLKVLGIVMLPFAIGSKTFPFEAHVIQDLTSHGKEIFPKICVD